MIDFREHHGDSGRLNIMLPLNNAAFANVRKHPLNALHSARAL